MGLATASMHYMGMLAMRLEATAQYDLTLVVLSVVIALSASLAALWLAFHLKTETTLAGSGRKIGSAIMIGNAIAGMHYTAMAAVSFKLPNQLGKQPSHVHVIDNSMLAVGIGIATLVILALVLLTSFNRRISTETARAEAFCQNEESCRVLVQYSSDIITILEADGTIRYTSLSVEQIRGYKPEELVGKNVFDKLHPEDVPKCRAALAHVIQKPGFVVTIECRFQHANGSWIHLESVCNNLLNDTNIKGVVVNSRDITERKRAEERLRLFESVVVNANDAVLITEAEPIDNLGPRIVYVNEAFTHMTGYSLEEVLGKTPRILQGPKTDRATLDKIRTALQAWQPVRVELIDYCKDGSEFWVELNIAPVADETGWYTHWISVQRDITERKRVEEEILRALEKEKELGELKSRFVSMTSHEFRTPLTTILSSVELLEYYGYKFTEQEKLDTFNQIRTAIKRMTQLLDDFLAINRVEAGKLEFKPAPLDLEKFCRELIEELQLNAGTKHLHIFSLVSQCQCTNACMDEKLLRHIFSNLLSNAVKYSPEGGTIHFEVDCQNEQVIFQVKDEGIGIPSEDQQQLFDLFHRAKNVGNIPGTGLGVSIVKRLVDLHKGTITVASKVRVGTTFTVTLPSNRGMNK